MTAWESHFQTVPGSSIAPTSWSPRATRPAMCPYRPAVVWQAKRRIGRVGLPQRATGRFRVPRPQSGPRSVRKTRPGHAAHHLALPNRRELAPRSSGLGRDCRHRLQPDVPDTRAAGHRRGSPIAGGRVDRVSRPGPTVRPDRPVRSTVQSPACPRVLCIFKNRSESPAR